ncbi:MAG: hypothetical protein SPF17_02155 [Candidatus Mucispirillum faecigallinarum]|nr:hypothetical protein [Candidatus Mucispirillum faecigallinarum]
MQPRATFERLHKYERFQSLISRSRNATNINISQEVNTFEEFQSLISRSSNAT